MPRPNPSTPTFRLVTFAVLTRIAAGAVVPKRHAPLYLAGWLAARCLTRTTFIHGVRS